MPPLSPSPLTQGRELKRRCLTEVQAVNPSPLTQGRELKHKLYKVLCVLMMSPLTQGRELKLYQRFFGIALRKVAPHAGA